MKKVLSFLTILAGFMLSNACVAQGPSGYKVIKTFRIASSGGWDYILANGGKLYASHGTQVNILDQKSGDSLGVIPNTTGVHGIAIHPTLGKGYTSNGRLNNLTVFDVKTFNILRQIAVGQNPDAIMYEPFTQMIITCNGRSNDLSIVDPEQDKLVATIPVEGKPETAVSDGAGKLYVNIEDKNKIDVVDLNSKKVVNSWSLAPGEGPTGLAIDLKTKRLFAGCDKLLIVLDAENGTVVEKVAIGNGCDGVAFDPTLKYIFASCGEGVLSVIQESSENQFKLVENVPTKRSARTIGIDEATHQVFLPAADLEPAAAGERPRMVPGSFQVLVVGR